MTIDECLESVSPDLRRAISGIIDRAGSYDSDWSVLLAAGESVVHLESQIASMNDVFTKIRMTAASFGLDPCPVEEPNPDGPWLPVGLMQEIDDVMTREYRL